MYIVNLNTRRSDWSITNNKLVLHRWKILGMVHHSKKCALNATQRWDKCITNPKIADPANPRFNLFTVWPLLKYHRSKIHVNIFPFQEVLCWWHWGPLHGTAAKQEVLQLWSCSQHQRLRQTLPFQHLSKPLGSIHKWMVGV